MILALICLSLTQPKIGIQGFNEQFVLTYCIVETLFEIAALGETSLKIPNDIRKGFNRKGSSEMDSRKLAGEVIDRIKAVLNLRSDREMARHFGYGTTSITSKRQRGSVPYEECVHLAETQNIDLNWLVLGKGDSPLEGRTPALGLITLNGAQLPPGKDYAGIDLYDIDAAAGSGRALEHEKVESTVYFERTLLEERGLCVDTLIGARVSGDSMNDTLKDGDRVLVDRAQVKPDGVFLFRMDDELRIKRLQRAAGGALRILSDNPRYSPELVRPEDMSKVEIIGRCEVVIGRII